jgi:hypothetical protein
MFQGPKFREERNAVWDKPFYGAFHLPREVYSQDRDSRDVELTVVMLKNLSLHSAVKQGRKS